ncbi:hypothetical protein HDV00_007155 [Rhizophlyctis rosea]|nr:hypothetical protein HDV00_007155 [Rhizophlyctis rosea]
MRAQVAYGLVFACLAQGAVVSASGADASLSDDLRGDVARHLYARQAVPGGGNSSTTATPTTTTIITTTTTTTSPTTTTTIITTTTTSPPPIITTTTTTNPPDVTTTTAGNVQTTTPPPQTTVESTMSNGTPVTRTVTRTASPTASATAPPVADTGSSQGLSQPAKIGIGVAAGAVILAALGLFIFRKLALRPSGRFRGRLSDKFALGGTSTGDDADVVNVKADNRKSFLTSLNEGVVPGSTASSPVPGSTSSFIRPTSPAYPPPQQAAVSQGYLAPEQQHYATSQDPYGYYPPQGQYAPAPGSDYHAGNDSYYDPYYANGQGYPVTTGPQGVPVTAASPVPGQYGYGGHYQGSEYGSEHYPSGARR